MTPEHEQMLYRAYPEIFRQKDWDQTRTGMCWGFQCEDGWWALIDAVCEVMTGHAHSGAHGILEATTVKQKFGALRVYFDGACDFCQGACRMVERYSTLVCEVSGRPGWKMTANPPRRWVQTLAPDIAELTGFHDEGRRDPPVGTAVVKGVPPGWQRLAHAVIDLVRGAHPDTVIRLGEVGGNLVASNSDDFDPEMLGGLACAAALSRRINRETGAFDANAINLDHI